jgi:hypothetical protein
MKKILGITAAVVFVVGLFVLPVSAGDQITIKGEILENGTLYGEDGLEYSFADNEKGEEVMDMEGKIVIIKGTVAESEGEKKITIESYEVTNESSGG